MRAIPRNKGTNYCHITKTLIRRRGGDLEARFLEQLTPEERRFHDTALATTWLDAAMASRLLARAGKLLFPAMKKPLYECGRLEAREHLSTGVYRVLVPFLSVDMVVAQTAKIWSKYHDRGEARSERIGPGHTDVIVTGYPELSPELRDVVAGYVAGAMEIAGARAVHVTLDESDPDNWVFKAKHSPK